MPPFGIEPWLWTLTTDALWACGALLGYLMARSFLPPNMRKVVVELRFLLVFFLLYDFTRLLVVGSPDTAVRNANLIHRLEVRGYPQLIRSR